MVWRVDDIRRPGGEPVHGSSARTIGELLARRSSVAYPCELSGDNEAVSNADPAPTETALTPATAASSRGVQVIDSREVPLGGPRAMTVRRTLAAAGSGR